MERRPRTISKRGLVEKPRKPRRAMTAGSGIVPSGPPNRQDKRPDVDTLAALCKWSGLSADDFIAYDEVAARPEPLAEIVGHLRADKNLKPEGAQAIEVMIRAAYEQFRKEKVGGED